VLQTLYIVQMKTTIVDCLDVIMGNINVQILYM